MIEDEPWGHDVVGSDEEGKQCPALGRRVGLVGRVVGAEVCVSRLGEQGTQC